MKGEENSWRINYLDSRLIRKLKYLKQCCMGQKKKKKVGANRSMENREPRNRSIWHCQLILDKGAKTIE